MVRSKSKGQAWSLDLVIGVLVFLLAIGTIYSLLNDRKQDDPAPLRIESEVIATILTSETNQLLQVADNNQLQMQRLFTLAAEAESDYESLKKQLGVEHEFCIYLQDEEGNLIYIYDPTTGQKYTGVGSGTGEINLTNEDIPCGRLIS